VSRPRPTKGAFEFSLSVAKSFVTLYLTVLGVSARLCNGRLDVSTKAEVIVAAPTTTHHRRALFVGVGRVVAHPRSLLAACLQAFVIGRITKEKKQQEETKQQQ
jgi:hypothetical protein